MPEPGQILDGKYKVLGLFDRGGMGSIFEAEHVHLERRVALKFLKNELAENEEAKARFVREAKAAGRIGHDNVCEVLDFGVHASGLYFVMPLLKGANLADVIAGQGPLAVTRACDVATQVLRALAAAHEKGVIHRDLKPGNVFLTTVGDREDFVKVLDFGISKMMVPQEAELPTVTALTNTGAVLGTPFYMSPEQARGAKDVDGRIDLYALGVMLYEMLTGKRPITGDNLQEILFNIWNQPIAPPRAHVPDLPAAIEKVVLRSLARDRDERFGTAGQVARAIKDALAGEPSALPSTLDTLAPAGEDGVTSRVLTELAADDTPEPVLLVQTKPPPPETAGPVELDAPSRPSEGGLRTLWALGFLVTVGAVGLGATFWLRGAEIEQDARSTFVPLAQSKATPAHEGADSSPAQKGDSGPAIVVAPEPAALVKIELLRLPDDAVVIVDGVPIKGAAFAPPEGQQTAEVVVKAAGYRTWNKTVDTTKSKSLPVDMHRRSDVRGPPSKEPAAVSEPAKQPGDLIMITGPEPPEKRDTAFGTMP